MGETVKETDFEKLPISPVLGVNYFATDMQTIVDYVINNIENLKGKYACFSNVHTTVMANDNEKYKNILNSGALIFPDGKPISIVQKLKGTKNAHQLLGPEFFKKIMQHKKTKRCKHFFYGSTPETIELLKEKLSQNYVNAEIVGYYSPPFRELTEEEDKNIIKIINDSEANFLWVGLGAPKQETWMFEHKDKINALMLGVGAVFNFEAGNLKPMPVLMSKLCLGWLFRLIQEPKRLFMRYLITNTKFLWLIMRRH